MSVESEGEAELLEVMTSPDIHRTERRQTAQISFTDGQVIHNSWPSEDAVPANTALSDTVSKALKEKGFSFVGSTICYSFLQAGGVVNDHLMSCYRHAELQA